MKILAVIPARGGSKGIKKKNIKRFCGKPLIYWTIQAAKKCSLIKKIIVSTDNNEIARIAAKYGCEVPFLRPKHLAKDHVSAVFPAIHGSNFFPEYDWIMLLQPTSPLRKTSDIYNVINIAKKYKNKSIVSVSKSLTRPELMYSIENKNSIRPLIQKKIKNKQRQDFKTFYKINGSIYFIKSNILKKTKSFLQKDTVPYVMPISRSIDIDNKLDWKLAEYFANQKFPFL
jgi:CMP-N,N'-diacetyllegionaminic acid synthase